MLKIKKFCFNMVGTSCYVVSDDTKEAMIVDCGAYTASEEISLQNYIAEQQLQIKHHVLTHTHFDHIFGCGMVANHYQVAPSCHALDADLYNSMSSQCTNFLGIPNPKEMPALRSLLQDGDTISFGNQTFEVLHTPGHTPGGISLYNAAEQVVFTGDSLFSLSIGRTDFPGGNHSQLIQSIRERLLVLPEQTVVYPGHGPETNIGYEKTNNPFL